MDWRRIDGEGGGKGLLPRRRCLRFGRGLLCCIGLEAPALPCEACSGECIGFIRSCTAGAAVWLLPHNPMAMSFLRSTERNLADAGSDTLPRPILEMKGFKTGPTGAQHYLLLLPSTVCWYLRKRQWNCAAVLLWASCGGSCSMAMAEPLPMAVAVAVAVAVASFLPCFSCISCCFSLCCVVVLLFSASVLPCCRCPLPLQQLPNSRSSSCSHNPC